MSGIYIHIPFCHKACHYCDFHFSTNLQYVDRMVNATVKEIHQRSKEIDSQIETIYFGGGTPSVLTQAHLAQILDEITRHFAISKEAEVTLEANPEDLTMDKLTSLKSLGINRLSIGVQSFDDELLQLINRNHDKETALKAIDNARAFGFSNLTIDLIFGLPSADPSYFAKDLETALKLDIPHLSVYGLTVEEGTVFGNWASKGKIKIPGESTHLQHYQLAEQMLESEGYIHYEVSNYAKKEAFSRHNSSYWLGTHYLGIGPGAHSYDGDSRRINVSNNPLYMKAIEGNSSFYEIEQLTDVDKINEYILTRSRTIYGMDNEKLKSETGVNLIKEKREILNRLESEGLISIEHNVINLTKAGLIIADEIAVQLFFDE